MDEVYLNRRINLLLVSLKVIGIFDEDGNAQESAPHPKQMLHVVFDGETEPQDILRRQEPDEKQ